jgi:Protein of unknown function (DUF1569)
MQSVFDSVDNQALISRINQLTQNTHPVWGSMTVSQMLVHCQQPIKVAFGELKLKRGLLGYLFGGFAKHKLLEDKPFPKNLPTVAEFKIKEDVDFDIAKNDLIHLIGRFAEKGEKSIVIEVHPFFGKMNLPEWNALQWKHLDHHLRQFGV